MGRRSGWSRLIPAPDIKFIDPDDWRIWRQLRLASLTDSPEAFYAKLSDWQGAADCEERWRSRLASPSSCNLAALVDQQPIGMVAGLPQADGSLELISMWVDPLYRGKGVAAALVTTLVNWAEQSRYSPVTLRVHPENARALGFYRGFGFRDQHLNEEGDLVMQLFQ